MKLHVVMPVINNIDLTGPAIESIGTPAAVHLIDNKSDDGTQAWGEARHGKTVNLSELDYIRNEDRKSVAASWNQGVRKSFEDPECEYIAILNNDIVLHPKTLNHLIQFMDKTGYLMTTGDNIKDRMSLDSLLGLSLPMPYTDFDCNPISDWRAEGPDFSCYMINRKTIEVVGWFDENYVQAYCEDQDYHVRAQRALAHARLHNDQGIEPERIHFKRLSTAPYYHYASQTIARNLNLRHDISTAHGRNQAYYVSKWGGEHPYCMDGNGHIQPFGDATKNWRDW